MNAFWQNQLAKTLHIRSRACGLRLERPLQLISASSEILDCSAGKNWLATGDAALSFDPLSSQGIYYALKSGLLAARAIQESLHGNRTAMAALSLRMRQSFDHYRQMRLSHYAREQRWSDSLFWLRRHSQ